MEYGRKLRYRFGNSSQWRLLLPIRISIGSCLIEVTDPSVCAQANQSARMSSLRWNLHHQIRAGILHRFWSCFWPGWNEGNRVGNTRDLLWSVNGSDMDPRMNNKLNATHNIANKDLALWSDDANSQVASNTVTLVMSYYTTVWENFEPTLGCTPTVTNLMSTLQRISRNRKAYLRRGMPMQFTGSEDISNLISNSLKHIRTGWHLRSLR